MYKPPSARRLEILLTAATRNEDALQELAELTNRMSDIANKRMYSLKQSGYDLGAYERAKRAAHELGGETFHKVDVRNLDLIDFEDLMFQAKETAHFLRRRESTIAGAKKSAEKMLDIMIEQGWITERPTKKGTIVGLAALMSTGNLSAYIASIYESEETKDIQELVSGVTTKLDKGTSVNTINRILKEYLTGARIYEGNNNIFE